MKTNNHPAHGPVSLDRLHQISEILSKASAQSDGGNLGYAMADAVKVIDGAIAEFSAEPVVLDECTIFDAAIDKCRTSEAIDEHAWNHGVLVVMAKFEECRAAMLQAGNSPSKCSLRDGIEAIRNSGISVDVDKIQSERVAGNHTEQHIDMVDHFVDVNEKVDCRLPFDQWLSQQNEPIDVDCGCVTTEAFYHWLRVAYEVGNSPVNPDGWVMVPKELTCEMDDAAWEVYHETRCMSDIWAALLAAAPQQEVKSALEHGMQRYSGAMQKLSEGDK
ncbi:hypothetical protein [Citrobacter meridianamericanus]|uniref:hypothetical protein n=1 Tax=Citrobacter meridianamericanus TaxID=2894201 RepID=UPI00351D4653